MKPLITFSDDSVGDGAVSVILNKLIGFTFKVRFSEPNQPEEGLHESTLLTGAIVRATDEFVVIQHETTDHFISIDSIEFLEYQ